MTNGNYMKKKNRLKLSSYSHPVYITLNTLIKCEMFCSFLMLSFIYKRMSVICIHVTSMSTVTNSSNAILCRLDKI